MKSFTIIFFVFLTNIAFTQNLVPNGDFENGSTGWSGGTISADNPHQGKYCMYVKDENKTSNIAASSGLISISQNEYYRFSLWYRSSISGHKILVAINQYDNNGNWISGNNIDMPLVAGTEWRFFQVIVRSFNPKMAMIRINLYATLWTDRGELTGDAFYDEVIFEKVTISDMTYGSYLMSDSDISIWQSPVTQKVQKNMRPSGENTVDKAIFYIAKGEYEALQIVVTPAKDITLINIAVDDFISEKGRLNVQTLKIYIAHFVNITQPTDISSLKGEVPDPLVEPDFPINIKANQSQPFYIVIKIPEEATPGLYESKIRFILSNGTEKEIKAVLRIWDFEVPKRHSLRTAFGFNHTNLDFYHNLGGNYEDMKNVAELYIKDMAEHRISPIDPFLDDYYSLTITLTGFIGGKVVTDGVTSNHFIEVDDNSPTECINAYFYKKIKIERDADYYLGWKAKGNVGSDYLIAINQYDSNQKWISGANLDFVRSSNGDWNSESVTIDRNQIRSNTEYIGVRLYARKWTPSCELMGKTVFDDIILRKIGTNENLIFNGNFESEISDALVDVDFSKFDKRAEYVFDTLNFDSFSLRLYNFAGGDWTGQYTDVDILGYKWGTKEYEDLFIKITQTITKHLKNIGILKYAYTYWYDEPEEKDYELVKYGNALIHRAEPELKRLLTEQIEPSLIGFVDIWVPVLYEFNPTLTYERQKVGEEVFWYVCTTPKTPYPNFFIDHIAIEHRILFWMNWKYNVTGTLYWQTNYWDDCINENGYQNPYLDPQSYVCNQPQKVWGNGDGRLIYPPYRYSDGLKRISGPVTSIRWELIRDGIEDYEYFSLLKGLVDEAKGRGLSDKLISDAEKLLSIPEEIIFSTTDYSKDPMVLENYRIEIGNTIEKLSLLLKNQALDGGMDIPEDNGIEISDTSSEIIGAELTDYGGELTFKDAETDTLEGAGTIESDSTSGDTNLSGMDEQTLKDISIYIQTDDSIGCGCNFVE